MRVNRELCQKIRIYAFIVLTPEHLGMFRTEFVEILWLPCQIFHSRQSNLAHINALVKPKTRWSCDSLPHGRLQFACLISPALSSGTLNARGSNENNQHMWFANHQAQSIAKSKYLMLESTRPHRDTRQKNVVMFSDCLCWLRKSQQLEDNRTAHKSLTESAIGIDLWSHSRLLLCEDGLSTQSNCPISLSPPLNRSIRPNKRRVVYLAP